MHLLIDGKNLLYRGIYASLNTKTKDHFVAISRMMYSYLHKFDFRNIHVFWDDHKENLWRRELLPDYKEAPCREKSDDVSQKLVKYQTVCEDVWENMNIKQYKKDNMEADDLIFAFCHAIGGDIIIVSNDGDMLQMPHRYDNVKVYNPSKKIICDRPIMDPVILKCLDGDTSDNIKGYYGVGPKKAAICAADPRELWALLEEKGTEIYDRNRRLIDLTMCPSLAENVLHIIERFNQPTTFDKKVLVELLYRKHKIKGIMAEYKSVISPFKLIGEKNGNSRSVY
jgi:5'-3' exonuclease